MNKYVSTGVVLATVVMMGAGCASYRLGTTLPGDIKTISVPVFINDTKEPLLETPTTSATVNEFQREGTLSVRRQDQADTLLEVTLTALEIEPLRYSREENLTGVQYRMKIHAHMVFSKMGAEKEVLLERKVIGEETYFLIGDMSSSKRRAIPEAARDLAHHMVESIVEYW